MNFGIYYLGQDFSEIAENATEITYINRAAKIRAYEDEIEYHVNNAIFCKMPWATFVGVLQDKVFSIGLQLSENQLASSLTGDILFDIVIKELNDKLSIFTLQQEINNFTITLWETTWGNVTFVRAGPHEIKGRFKKHETYTLLVEGLPVDNDKNKKRDPFMDIVLRLNDFSAS